MKAKDGLEYNLVDFGLPSGNLWCDRCMGATEVHGKGKSRDAEHGLTQGNYYRWGDIKPFTKRTYNMSDFESNKAYLCVADETGRIEFGHMFNEPIDYIEGNTFVIDPCSYIMGDGFKVPTVDDFEELWENTEHILYNKWADEGYGIRIQSKTDESVGIDLDMGCMCHSHYVDDPYAALWTCEYKVDTNTDSHRAVCVKIPSKVGFDEYQMKLLAASRGVGMRILPVYKM